MDTPTEILVTPVQPTAPPVESSHNYTGELVVVITRTRATRTASAMEEYMRSYAPDDLDPGDTSDVSVIPTPCGVQGCVVCNTSTRVLDKLRIDNLRAYLEGEALKLASASQRIRMATEETRADEILGIARGELFKPFADFVKRPKRWASAVVHAADCAGPDVRWFVSRSSAADAHGLTPEETANLRAIGMAARQTAQHEWLTRTTVGSVVIDLKIQTHVGTCATCDASHVDHGVLVTIPWADRTLSREYLL